MNNIISDYFKCIKNNNEFLKEFGLENFEKNFDLLKTIENNQINKQIELFLDIYEYYKKVNNIIKENLSTLNFFNNKDFYNRTNKHLNEYNYLENIVYKYKNNLQNHIDQEGKFFNRMIFKYSYKNTEIENFYIFLHNCMVKFITILPDYYCVRCFEILNKSNSICLICAKKDFNLFLDDHIYNRNNKKILSNDINKYQKNNYEKIFQHYKDSIEVNNKAKYYFNKLNNENKICENNFVFKDITKINLINFLNSETFCIKCEKEIEINLHDKIFMQNNKYEIKNLIYCKNLNCNEYVEKNEKTIKIPCYKCNELKEYNENNFFINKDVINENQINLIQRTCKSCDKEKYGTKRKEIANNYIKTEIGKEKNTINQKTYQKNNYVGSFKEFLKETKRSLKDYGFNNEIIDNIQNNLFKEYYQNMDLNIIKEQSFKINEIIDLPIKNDLDKINFSNISEFNESIDKINKDKQNINDKLTIDHIVPRSFFNKKIKKIIKYINQYNIEKTLIITIIFIFNKYVNYENNIQIITKLNNSRKNNQINDEYFNVEKKDEIINKIKEELKKENINKEIIDLLN